MNAGTRRRWFVAAALGAVALGVLVISGAETNEPRSDGPRPRAATRSGSGVAAAARETNAPAAVAYHARLVDEGSVLSGGSAGTRGQLTLEGTVVVQDVRTDPTWRSVSVHAVDAASWTFDDRALPDAAARFREASVFFRTDDAGHIREVEAPEGLAAPVARVLEIVALALGEEMLTPQETRVAEVRSVFGDAHAAMGATADCAEAPCGFEVHYAGTDLHDLTRGDAATGSGTRRAEREAGRLVRVNTRESFRVTRGRAPLGERTITLELQRVASPDAVRRPRFDGPRTSVRDVRGDARRRALEQRAGGLTVAQMLADLEAFRGGRLPDHDRWLWRATGLLQLDPEAAAALARACLDGTLDGARRDLAVELLANVGDAPAQRALRTVWADAGFTQSDEYPGSLQRAALIRQPDEETISLLSRQAESLDGAASRSAYVATGAALGHAREQDASRGQEIIAGMRRRFAQTSDPISQRALVMALGNTAAPAALPELTQAATSVDPALRATAARALAHIDTPESAAQLAAMTRDDDGVVQRAALAALAVVSPTSELLADVATAVPTMPEGTRIATVEFVRHLHASGDANGADLLRIIEALRTAGDLPDDSAHQMMALHRELSGQRGR